MTNEQISAASERLAAATPGPWAASNWSVVSIMDTYYRPEICRMGGYPGDHANDKDFIAHAPEDLRLALAEIERMRDLRSIMTKLMVARFREIAANWRAQCSPDLEACANEIIAVLDDIGRLGGVE